jgi:hypothetical protein
MWFAYKNYAPYNPRPVSDELVESMAYTFYASIDWAKRGLQNGCVMTPHETYLRKDEPTDPPTPEPDRSPR